MISTKMWLTLQRQAEEAREAEAEMEPPAPSPVPATREVRFTRTFTSGALKGLTIPQTIRCADQASAEAMVTMILREPAVADPVGGSAYVDADPVVHALGEATPFALK